MINEAVETYVPLKPSGLKKERSWLRRCTRKQISQKRRAWDHHSQVGSETSWSEYITIRNKCNASITKDKMLFQRNLTERIKSNPKSFFRFVSSISKAKAGITAIQTPRGLTETNKEAADVLADHFASVYKASSTDSQLLAPDAPVETSNLSKLTILPEQVSLKLANLDKHKSIGPDGIHPLFLKECAAELALPLSNLFQHSLDTGKVPTDWKHAAVTAIHKGGDRSIAANYRPIALLSIISKVLESLVDDYLRAYLHRTEFFTNQQHGFRTGHSCTTNLLLAQDSWTSSVDAGQGIDVIYLDFAKAFDSVDHSILLRKVRLTGVPSTISDWLGNYLADRSFHVRVQGSKSEVNHAPCGVPQGSILGPLLFLIFINDITEDLDCEIVIFADDIKVWISISTDQAGETLQCIVDRIHGWTLRNRLPLNVKKCTVLHINQKSPRTYHINGVALTPTTTQRDLGTIIASDLSCSPNAAILARKANSMARLVTRNMGSIHPNYFPPIFCSLIRPHLETNIQAAAPFLQKDINLLENVQRRATKRVMGLSRLSYPERLRRLNMFSLEHRRLRGDMILTHKILSTASHPCAPLLNISNKTHLRGHSLKLDHLPSRLRIRHQSFAVRVPRYWNLLPAYVISAKTTREFKLRFDSYHTGIHHNIGHQPYQVPRSSAEEVSLTEG